MARVVLHARRHAKPAVRVTGARQTETPAAPRGEPPRVVPCPLDHCPAFPHPPTYSSQRRRARACAIRRGRSPGSSPPPPTGHCHRWAARSKLALGKPAMKRALRNPGKADGWWPGTAADRAPARPCLPIRGTAPALLFVALILAAVLGVSLWLRSSREARVSEAIRAAVDACGTGSGSEYARRLVDANAAIRQLPIAEREEATAKLENALRFSLCR